MGKINIYSSRTLKLTNVLILQYKIENKDMDFSIAIEQMQSFIRTKGAIQVGPFIQYTNSCINENEELEMDIKLMLQCNTYIHNIEQPYKMESILRIPNCMYCRYIGPEDKLNLAYDKLQIEAFENDIELKSASYVIFVDRNENDETIIADVFMERAD